MGWKTRKGLPAFSYDVNDIYANYAGRDDAEKIRNFLISKYDGGNGPLRWVQIVGDTDAVPTREVWNPRPLAGDGDSWIPTDAYYSCLDLNTNWDKNNNSVFGELLDTNSDGIYDYTDLDDVYPDVPVARFASSDPAKVAAWASNAVDYEKGTNSGAWMNSCNLVAPNAGGLNTAASVMSKMEQFVNKTQGYGGYLGPYYGKIISNGAINRLYEYNGTLSSTAFINTLNGPNGYAFGTWIADGDSNSFSSATSGIGTIFSSGDVAGLTNGVAKPVLFAVSSQSGRFDGQECLGEALTENNLANGAMGFIGPSRVTQATSDLGYWGNATGLLMDFLYAMQLGRTTNATFLYAGETLVESKYLLGWDFSFMNEAAIKAFYEYNLFGETNSPVWTDTPGLFNPTARVHENADYKNVTIWVRNAITNGAANNTLVCLYYTNATVNYYQYTETDSSGYANFTIPKDMSDGTEVITRADIAPTDAGVALTDSFAPATTMVVNPAHPDGKNNWYKTTPSITLVSDDPDATTYYRWDDSPVNITYHGEVLPTQKGTHTLHFHGVDWIGNAEFEQSWPIKVDDGVPVTNVTVVPAAPDGNNGWYVHQPVVTLEGTGNVSSQIKLKFKMDADPDFADYMGPITIDPDGTTSQDGIHTLYFYAESDAGNQEVQRTLTFKVDLHAPSSTAMVTPAKTDGLHGWYIKAPTVSFIVDEPNTNISYFWDGNAPANLSPSASLTPPEGVHTLFYRCVDDAGNMEDIKNLTVKLDSVVPVTTITTDPSAPDGLNGWYVSRPSLSFDAGQNAVTMHRWNLDSYANVTGPVRAPEGTNTLSYYSVDDAGNKETARLTVFKVDTVVPVSNITVSPADKGDQWYTKRPKVQLSNSENTSMFYYWGTDVTGVQNYSKPFDVPDGRQLLHFWAMDVAGNKEQERTKEFWVDTVLPQVTITPSAVSLTEGDSVTFSLGGTDSNGVQEYNVDFGDGNSTGWIQNLSVTHTYSAAGNYTVRCRAHDPALNEGSAAAQTIEVKAKYVPPVVKPAENKEGPNMLLIGGVVGILVIAGVVGIVAMRRRKGMEKDDFFIEQKKEAERKALMPAYDYGPREGEGAAVLTGSETVAETAPLAAAAPAESAPPSSPGAFNCPKCGNEVEAGADYCYTCGERFKKKGSGPGIAPPAPPQAEAPRQMTYAPAQQEAPRQAAYAQAVPEGPVYEAPAEPAYEAPARPFASRPPPAAQRPAGGAHDLTDIMRRLESISKPVAAAPAAQARQPAGPLPPRPVQGVSPQRTAQPARSPAAAAPTAPAATSASAETATGKMCPKCGSEMARLVDLPGAQGEQLRKLNAKGQHAFQCPNCNHFEVAPWTPPR
jgi:plastocyanin/predicted RNA-binding Zn-ribbon protein involved in translation (DUF1610 family)/predicted nucleic-acid-binding Zn-ribbon protein